MALRTRRTPETRELLFDLLLLTDLVRAQWGACTPSRGTDTWAMARSAAAEQVKPDRRRYGTRMLAPQGPSPRIPSRKRAWALVTGASSGLGSEFARQLAAGGYDVVLVARRRDRLDDLAREVQLGGAEAIVIASDLAAEGAPAALLEALDARGVAPELLVNNAGVGLHGAAVDQPTDAVRAMLRLNVLALTELALAMGRKMAERGSGAIVNVSSTTSFQPDPWFAVYGASKAYVTSFSLALAEELAPRGVHVMALCPGPTRTEFNKTAGLRLAHDPAWAYMSAERCVATALRGLHRRRRVVVTGWGNRIAAFFSRRAPLGWATRVSALVLAPRHDGR